MKKYTNPYEYIYSNHSRTSISKYKPISRAYYKMIEIINTFHLLPKTSGPMQMFGLAEGPGGFIEAVVNSRKADAKIPLSTNKGDKYYGMTIEDPSDDNVPGWKKTQHFLRLNPNIELEKGIDGTGNLLDVNNFLYVAHKYRNTMDLVTGDGGFDFSDNFGGQEQSMVKLLFAQIVFALVLQKPGGSFVLKMFDCFLKPTTELLYLLSSSYENVYICKPNTSRCANSERYVVCVGFKGTDWIKGTEGSRLIEALERALSQICNINNERLHIKSIFSNTREQSSLGAREQSSLDGVHIPIHYYNKIEECNCIIGQMQLENISETLSLMESKYKSNKVNNYLRMNMQKCIQWCVKNNIEYNTNANINENNIFKPLREKEMNVKIHAFKLSDYE